MNTVTVKNVTLGSGSPKIIVPLVGKNETELIEEANHLVTIDCDLVEWRVDFFDQVADFQAAAEMSKKIAEILNDKPVLFTFRTKQEGGEIAFSDEQYFGLYKTVIENGTIDLLDVELFMDDALVQQTIQAAHEKDIKIVMCNHDFDKTPNKEEIVSRLCRMQEKNADICKIAVMPQSSDDVLTLLSATNEMKTMHANRPIVTMSMGQLGMVSRMCGEVFGSAMTFGAAKKASAPGQVPVGELRDVLKTLAL
ncbi:3-dehydroquinate dehydratase, type I [Enterococcus haemoperoxidus ATCC BAA-382]|uniref:3-dehydroquinate dehydratase n=1 Tax=Enterococcus haemoperoxidus ATCC BAA-382 TaxID=1158608 RepID=R2STV0_9ENTE|nr:type I 3-dehydroquinate dehydratase [Enterococcus haemoperoxidus]EOH98675.1 3-dehydroquinate dehydratase, type I [Enterococcus haemoperoxidus ATCC BAA-382]EOT62142.1 3-dehydroquinate dehydratase, type I [Enterococcus haemoperoxidus ATCC BAA-382]OJG55777.1 3-dehydroquinate dehydratase, type I [Enterococcus haemoperoxidus]